jgi:hypothetical protein
VTPTKIALVAWIAAAAAAFLVARIPGVSSPVVLVTFFATWAVSGWLVGRIAGDAARIPEPPDPNRVVIGTILIMITAINVAHGSLSDPADKYAWFLIEFSAVTGCGYLILRAWAARARHTS